MHALDFLSLSKAIWLESPSSTKRGMPVIVIFQPSFSPLASDKTDEGKKKKKRENKNNNFKDLKWHVRNGYQ